MPKINRPRRGSLAFSPRKRAKSPIPKYQSWPLSEGAPILQGFAGYKVGMTHVIMVDDHKNSPTEGKEIMVPGTVIEVPSMKVAAIRAYSRDTYGKHALTEVWADQLDTVLGRRITLPKDYNGEDARKKLTDAVSAGTVAEIYAVTYTQPAALSGVPKKSPISWRSRLAGQTSKNRWTLPSGFSERK
jgi:large subunit ribosomal protein L3